MFRQEMLSAVENFSRVKPIDPPLWDYFSEHIFYHRSEFDHDEGYESLKKLLDDLDKKMGTQGNRVFYLSTQPSYFPLIIEKLSKHQLIYNQQQVQNKWSRVIIEKPFGHDLSSAVDLQNELRKHLDESQIYRIDHYLGKETVQNLLVFRFGNPIFENIWNNRYIDNVQITVSEEIGIGTRGRFWEESGIIRDIMQNHMMQLISLVAMEPPFNLQAESIHDEKVKVLKSIRAFPTKKINTYFVRGQYGPGYEDGKLVKGYRQEDNVDPKSNVETYIAAQFMIDNWRWVGCALLLKGGKTVIQTHYRNRDHL